MKSIGEDETTFRQVCHSLIQRHGAYRSINVVRSRLGLLKQANTEKLEESPDQAGQWNPVEDKPLEESLRAPRDDTN